VLLFEPLQLVGHRLFQTFLDMSVSEKDVERVAELANLELTSGEKAGMLRDLNSVLGYFAELNELDTSSVPPMEQVSDLLSVGQEAETETVHLRADEIAPSLNREQVLACAPDTDGVFFKVPKVIER
jgi:aspartyl-tRNA(Asn)/glutamyl-tRNA(Gln) amidotransferase subunit C